MCSVCVNARRNTNIKQSIFMLHILELPLNSINYRFVHNIQFNICVKARFISYFLFIYLYFIYILIQHALENISQHTDRGYVKKLNENITILSVLFTHYL